MSYTENLFPDCYYTNSSLYMALADYCDSRGMTEEQFEAAAKHTS